MSKDRDSGVISRPSNTILFIAGLMLVSACAGGGDGKPGDEPVAEAAQASLVSYTPQQDTWALRDSGFVDWGTSRELRTNNIDVAAKGATILVRFDINLATVCPTLSSATLSLHSAQLGGPLPVYVHPITSMWTPSATGSLAPLSDCAVDSGASAVFAHPTFASPSAKAVVDQGCTRFTWDVTSIVLTWCNNPGTNHGFLLAGHDPNGSNTAVNFFSMEAAIDRRPTLDITY